MNRPLADDWGKEEYIALSEGVLAPIFPVLAKTALRQMSQAVDRLDVLDLGGGTGQWLEAFAIAGIRSGCLVDLAAEMIRHARRRWERSGTADRLSGVLGDAGAIPIRSGSFGLVVSRNSLHLWPVLEPAMAEIARILQPDGIAFLGRGYGPDLDQETRRQVKEQRKRLFEPDPGSAEPPSPEPEMIAAIAARLGLAHVRTLPDARAFWIVFRREGRSR